MAQTCGCLPELSPNCIDMTNSSSTYLGIIIGAIIGAIISWLIFNRQKKTSGQTGLHVESHRTIRKV